MSSAIAVSTGNVRSARKTPPIPVVSPIVCRRPCAAGICRSASVGVDAADLNHVDDEIGAVKRCTSIRRRRDVSTRAEPVVHVLRGSGGDGQAGVVDVVQHEAHVRELRVAQDVGDQLTRENDTSCTNECDVDHSSMIADCAYSAQ